MKFLLFLVLLFPLLALADQDDDFLAARDAFRAGDTARLDRLAARLKHSPLEPYLAYYQLRLNLGNSDAATIQAFLARTDNTAVIDRLRGEWLKQLGKNQQWDAFSAEYPRLLNEDVELSCYALQARLRTQQEEALHEARNLWLSSGKEFPGSCGPLFTAAIDGGIISESDIWARLRLALEAGSVSLAQQLAERLPPKRALSAAALDKAEANPARYLNNVSLANASEAQRTVAMFALQRLAKQSPQLAFDQWGKIAEHFHVAERHYFFSWLAYEAARKQDARALEWYHAAGDIPLTDAQLSWRARAALRAQDWREVLVTVYLMKPQQQREGVWRYWKARALARTGQAVEAEKLFEALSGEYNFYGQLAAEERGATPSSGMLTASFQPGKEELKEMLAQPAIQRTLALYRMDMRTDAAREWTFALSKFNDRQLLLAAEIARRNEMFDRAISAADRTVQLHDFNLRYLSPYRTELQGHIRDNDLDEAWVYGLMRQESRFVTKAKSTVGASGLMQIMPATARWVARKLGLKSYRNSLIQQMETNLKLGTYYMKSVLALFDNNPVLASAAYNAGPSRARHWRGDTALEGAVYAETIPFDETRDYVKKVMSNTVYYSKLFGQPQQTLKQRLGVIVAKNPSNQQPVPDEK